MTTEPIFILGHSFGGDVAILAINMLDAHYSSDNIEGAPEMILVTLNTPRTRPGRAISENINITHYNIYSTNDYMSPNGQIISGGPFSLFLGKEFPGAINVSYEDKYEGNAIKNGEWNHMGFWEKNFKAWKPKLDEKITLEFNKLETLRKSFEKKIKNREIENRSTKKDNLNLPKPMIDDNYKEVSSSPRNF